MDNLKQPLAYACKACDTMMRTYTADKLPPVGHFHYHQGVFLSGVLKTWELTGDKRYLQYAKDWIDSVFTSDGKIRMYNHGTLDDIQPGILLFPLLDAYGDDIYRKDIESVVAQIADIPRCQCGGFNHKGSVTRQMWLDGLYMSCPFIAEYARRFQRPELMDLAVREIFLMYEHTADKETGLLFHAWDETRTASWCNPETGVSPEFWGRSIGWVPVAILDVMAQMEPDNPSYTQLGDLVCRLLESILNYQAVDGRWYQVVNKGGQPGNWLENSCSSLFSAALSRGYVIGLLDESALTHAYKAFEGVVSSLTWQGEDLLIGNVCIGTKVGDYQFYCDRPVRTNDLHGVGTFLLMCTELEKALKKRKG